MGLVSDAVSGAGLVVPGFEWICVGDGIWLSRLPALLLLLRCHVDRFWIRPRGGIRSEFHCRNTLAPLYSCSGVCFKTLLLLSSLAFRRHSPAVRRRRPKPTASASRGIPVCIQSPITAASRIAVAASTSVVGVSLASGGRMTGWAIAVIGVEECGAGVALVQG